MDEKHPTFTVTDRRKFTVEGDLREGEADKAESPQQDERKSADNLVTMPSPANSEDEVSTGEPVEEEALDEAEVPQFSAKETAEQDAAYQESSRQLDDMLRQANPGMGATGVVSFEHVIQSFYFSAMISMGAGTEPGQKARIDILGARQSIDMLALLQEKTKGNLTPKEEATLQNVLFELRMMFLEITNAIAQSAQRPGNGKK